jgi:hypothetical protein
MLQSNLIWVVQSSREKSLVSSGKSPLQPRPVSTRQRGAFRDRHERWVGTRWTSKHCRTGGGCSDGEVVWFWHPDAGAKLAMMLRIPPTTGARKPVPREEHEGNRKTIARGMPVDFGVPVVTTLVCFLHLRTGLWVLAEHPAFPAPSSTRGRDNAKLGRDLRRENAGLRPHRCLTIE